MIQTCGFCFLKNRLKWAFKKGQTVICKIVRTFVLSHSDSRMRSECKPNVIYFLLHDNMTRKLWNLTRGTYGDNAPLIMQRCSKEQTVFNEAR